VIFSYEIRWDLEPSYDYAVVEYLNSSNVWTPFTVSGGGTAYTGSGSASENLFVPLSSLGPTVRFRFRVVTDASYSDEDGFYPSSGAITIDNVWLRMDYATVNFENFECELPGEKMTRSGKWAAGPHPGCGPAVPCDECAPTGALTINTGWDQFWGQNMETGKLDGEWIIVADTDPKTAEPRPARVIDPYPSWLTDSSVRWVSPYKKSEFDPDASYTFEYRFCMDDITGANLNIWIRADDKADIFLNGNYLASTGLGTHSSPNPPLHLVSNSFFVDGRNVLRVVLQNTNEIAMGLLVFGSIYGNVQYDYCCTDSTGVLAGNVFQDKTNFGIKDATDPGKPGWKVTLSNGASTTTDGFGDYYFVHVPPANYLVQLVYKPFTIATTTKLYFVPLATHQVAQDLDFGYRYKMFTHFQFQSDPPIVINPNPFNPATTISFTLIERARVSIRIFDVSGRLVRIVADEDFPPGGHKREWDGRNDAGESVASGMYFLKFVSNGSSQTKKLLMVK
jgi:hypothetical protein